MILDGTEFPVFWPYSHSEINELDHLGCPRSVPWALVEPHEAQAQRNHDQTLQRLAARGGLGPMELLAVLEDRPWRSMAWAEVVPALLAKIKDAVPPG